MSDHWRTIVDHLPFLTAMTNRSVVSVNYTRIVEAVLIASLTAIVTSYQTSERVSVRLEERVASLTDRITRCEQMIDMTSKDTNKLGERLAVCEARYKLTK